MGDLADRIRAHLSIRWMLQADHRRSTDLLREVAKMAIEWEEKIENSRQCKLVIQWLELGSWMSSEATPADLRRALESLSEEERREVVAPSSEGEGWRLLQQCGELCGNGILSGSPPITDLVRELRRLYDERGERIAELERERFDCWGQVPSAFSCGGELRDALSAWRLDWLEKCAEVRELERERDELDIDAIDAALRPLLLNEDESNADAIRRVIRDLENTHREAARLMADRDHWMNTWDRTRARYRRALHKCAWTLREFVDLRNDAVDTCDDLAAERDTARAECEQYKRAIDRLDAEAIARAESWTKTRDRLTGERDEALGKWEEYRAECERLRGLIPPGDVASQAEAWLAVCQVVPDGDDYDKCKRDEVVEYIVGLRRECERLRPVVEAAEAYSDALSSTGLSRYEAHVDLIFAIDAYRAHRAEKPLNDRVCPKCGGTSWGGGTDSDPRPWCNKCGEPQPGWGEKPLNDLIAEQNANPMDGPVQTVEPCPTCDGNGGGTCPECNPVPDPISEDSRLQCGLAPARVADSVADTPAPDGAPERVWIGLMGSSPTVQWHRDAATIPDQCVPIAYLSEPAHKAAIKAAIREALERAAERVDNDLDESVSDEARATLRAAILEES